MEEFIAGKFHLFSYLAAYIACVSNI